jgi:hypothetical protein
LEYIDEKHLSGLKDDKEANSKGEEEDEPIEEKVEKKGMFRRFLGIFK